MTRTPEEQAAWDQQCYGMRESAIDAEVERWKRSPLSLGGGDPKMLVFSMFSDVQELVEMGAKEQVRRQLNVAKYILHRHVKTLTDEEQAHLEDAAVSRFLGQTFEVEVPAEPDWQVPEVWHEKPVVRVRWWEDRGDPGAGIQASSGFALDPNQEGTVLADIMNKGGHL